MFCKHDKQRTKTHFPLLVQNASIKYQREKSWWDVLGKIPLTFKNRHTCKNKFTEHLQNLICFPYVLFSYNMLHLRKESQNVHQLYDISHNMHQLNMLEILRNIKTENTETRLRRDYTFFKIILATITMLLGLIWLITPKNT